MHCRASSRGSTLGRHRHNFFRKFRSQETVAPFDLDLHFPGSIYSVTTEEKAANPDVRAFRDWLRDEAANTPMGARIAA